MEVEYSASLGYVYTITLQDNWFEGGCGYIIEQTLTNGQKWFITGGEGNQYAIVDGVCVYGFIYPLKMLDVGCSLTFYKIKP